MSTIDDLLGVAALATLGWLGALGAQTATTMASEPSSGMTAVSPNCELDRLAPRAPLGNTPVHAG